MATKSSGWSCTHAVSVDNSDASVAKVTVTCYWQNSGWEYDINHVSAWVYCGSQSHLVKDSGSIDANSSTTQRVSCGSYTFTVNKTTSAQSLSCYAKITSKSSYVSGTKSSTATNASVSAKALYTITYNANGGNSAPSKQTKSHGVNIKLSTSTPTRTGYTFQGWGTSTSDTSVDYAPGATYSANASDELFAIWKVNTYTVSYNLNGGTGTSTAQTKTHGVALTLRGAPTKTNYTFVGWGTSASATTATYSAGGTYTNNANVTLYAIWTLAYTKPRISNVKIQRCDISGTTVIPNDEGNGFALYFDWTTDKSNPTYKVEWKLEGESWSKASTSGSKSLTGTSGTSECFSTTGVSTEKTYNVRLTVTDTSGYSEIHTDIPSLMMALDVYPAVSSYLHLETKTAGSGNERIYYRTSGDQYFTHIIENIYMLTFSAKSNVDGTILVSNVAGSASNLQNYTLTTEWSSYGVTYTAAAGGSLTFWLKDAGTECDIRDITIIHMATVDGKTQLISRIPTEASYDTSYWVHNGEGAFESVVVNNGLGVAIGKTAEKANLFDVAMQSRLRKTVCIGDKTGYLDGNSGVYLHSAGYIHLQRNPEDGHPYIGFLTDQGAGEVLSAFIRFNKSRSQLEYLNAPAHRFSQEIYVSADKLARNDGKAGWYMGIDGTAHATGSAPAIYFHNGTNTGATSYIKETASGVVEMKNHLAVTGDVKTNVIYSNTNTYSLRFGVADTPDLMWIYRSGGVSTGNKWLSPKTAGGLLLGASNYKWAEVWSNNALNTTSDRNVKKDITPIDERYEKLFDLLKPVTFKFVDGQSGRNHSGFISQDVEESLKTVGLTPLDFAAFCKDKKTQEVKNPETGEPTLVDVLDADGNPEYTYSLRYEEFIALNTHMIQKLQKENEDLKQRLEKLEKLLNVG